MRSLLELLSLAAAAKTSRMRPLPALSAGWALPAIEDLQAAELFGDLDEALGDRGRAGWRACRWRRGGRSRG